MSINLLTTYAKQIDQKLVSERFTGTRAKGEVRIIDAKAGVVEVLTPLSQALSDYDKTDNSDRYGGIKEMEDLKAIYTVQNDKSFKIGLDKANTHDQGNLKNASKMLKLQLKEQVAPAMDKVYFAKVAATAAATSQTKVMTAATAYDVVTELAEMLDEAEAPQANRTLFVTPTAYRHIKKNITTNINASKTNDKLLTKGFVGELDSFEVVKVPSKYFPANVAMLAVWEGAIANAPIIDEARIKSDSENISGDLLIGRNKFDTFILDAKKMTIASATTA